MKSNPRTSQSMSSEDGSVLFSLGSLVAKAEEGSQPRPRGAAKDDDSGLIDLKALEAAAAQAEPTPAVHVPIFPFGSPEPLPATPQALPATQPAELAPAHPRPTAAIAMAALGLVALAAAFFMAGARTEARSTLASGLSSTFEDAGKRAASAIPPAPVEVAAKNDAAPVEKESTSVKGSRADRAPIGNHPQRNRPVEPRKADPKPKPPPPPDPSCDLMCQMRRATGQK